MAENGGAGTGFLSGLERQSLEDTIERVNEFNQMTQGRLRNITQSIADRTGHPVEFIQIDTAQMIYRYQYPDNVTPIFSPPEGAIPEETPEA